MTETTERMLPLYEGRMGHQFDHRFASLVEGDKRTLFTEHQDPTFEVLPQYWVSEAATKDRIARRSWGTTAGLLGHRRVARNTDERTQISAIIPFGAASYGWILSAGPSARALGSLLAAYNSFAYDYLLRNALSQPSIPQGTSEQIPVPATEKVDELLESIGDCSSNWLEMRILELTFNSWDMRDFGAALGDTLAPFLWDERRRAFIRSELDAAFFHLYGIDRDDVDYVMDTFPIVKRKDEAEFGEYRTKRLILENYDRMQECIDTGTEFVSTLDPAPGFGPRHPERTTDA